MAKHSNNVSPYDSQVYERWFVQAPTHPPYSILAGSQLNSFHQKASGNNWNTLECLSSGLDHKLAWNFEETVKATMCFPAHQPVAGQGEQPTFPTPIGGDVC